MVLPSITCWFTPTVLFCVSNLIIFVIFVASNNNNNNNRPRNDIHGDSVTRVSSFLERAKSFKLTSYTTTTESQHEPYPSQLKTATYTSSSRLAQSILTEPSQPVHIPLLERVKSIKFSSFSYNGNENPTESEQVSNSPSQPVHTPSLLERVKSIKFSSSYYGNEYPTESEHVSNSTSQLTRAPSFFDRVKSFRISSSPTDHAPEHNVIRSKSEKTSVVKKKLKSMEMKKSHSEMKMALDEDEDVDLRRPATTRESRTIVDEEIDAKADDFISRFKQQLKLQRLESLVRYNELLKRRS